MGLLVSLVSRYLLATADGTSDEKESFDSACHGIRMNTLTLICRYYYDSAAGCGACCTLAGACRTLRKTWTGLGLAGLSALSCAGLLLLAAKSPKAGTPLHDVTAGALCGVSLLGAALALLALLAPKCNLGRHRRVHSWIPRLSP